MSDIAQVQVVCDQMLYDHGEKYTYRFVNGFVMGFLLSSWLFSCALVLRIACDTGH